MLGNVTPVTTQVFAVPGVPLLNTHEQVSGLPSGSVEVDVKVIGVVLEDVQSGFIVNDAFGGLFGSIVPPDPPSPPVPTIPPIPAVPPSPPVPPIPPTPVLLLPVLLLVVVDAVEVVDAARLVLAVAVDSPVSSSLQLAAAIKSGAHAR